MVRAHQPLMCGLGPSATLLLMRAGEVHRPLMRGLGLSATLLRMCAGEGSSASVRQRHYYARELVRVHRRPLTHVLRPSMTLIYKRTDGGSSSAFDARPPSVNDTTMHARDVN